MLSFFCKPYSVVGVLMSMHSHTLTPPYSITLPYVLILYLLRCATCALHRYATVGKSANDSIPISLGTRGYTNFSPNWKKKKEEEQEEEVGEAASSGPSDMNRK